MQITKHKTKQIITTTVKPLVGLKEKNGFEKVILYKSQTCKEGNRNRLGSLSIELVLKDRLLTRTRTSVLLPQVASTEAVTIATALCCRHGASVT